MKIFILTMMIVNNSYILATFCHSPTPPPYCPLYPDFVRDIHFPSFRPHWFSSVLQ